MHLENALERFMLQLEADGRSPHTVGQYRRHVRMFAAWLANVGHSGSAGDVTTDDLAAFLASDTVRTTAAGTPRKPGSANAIRGSLRGFFGYLVRAEVLTRDPSRLVRRAICAPPPPRALRPAEEERLLAVLRSAEGPEAERDRVLVVLMLRTGIRLSSALALDVGDVDLDDGVLLLRNVKGGRAERAFLGPAIRDLLGEYLGERLDGPVFVRRDGRRISVRQAQRRFRAWRERAGVTRSVTPHSLRHSFAMSLYEATNDVLLVKRALHHRSVNSTLVYADAPEHRVPRGLALLGDGR